jgi:hypothetical protein
MEDKTFRTVMIALVSASLLVGMVGGCNSCSSSRKIDDMKVANEKAVAAGEQARKKDIEQIGLMLQLQQPEIVSQFLQYSNATQYKNEIDINKERITNLQLQLKKMQENDTTKKPRLEHTVRLLGGAGAGVWPVYDSPHRPSVPGQLVHNGAYARDNVRDWLPGVVRLAQ